MNMKIGVTTALLVAVGLFSDERRLQAQPDGPQKENGETIRFATFNTALNCEAAGDLAKRLADDSSKKAGQARKIAEIIQRVRPQVILLNEFDRDQANRTDPDQALEIFRKKYLGVGQGQQLPIEYPYVFVGDVNTGVDSKLDLNNNEKMGEPQDAFGFGQFPGKYAMVVLSKYPIVKPRTFQKFLWKDMPDARWPQDPKTGKSYYSDEVKKSFRLSSKSHWDVPVRIREGMVVHFLCSHPTPPVFDGPEDRNGCRNHDEIRFLCDLIDGADYLYDDSGVKGGLEKGAAFVVAGDLNADPVDGDSAENAARLLTDHPLINSADVPSSGGAFESSRDNPKSNRDHRGNAAEDTCQFGGGNLRVDYVLPSKTLIAVRSGVFWPERGQAGSELVTASDHRLVWVEIKRRGNSTQRENSK